MHGVEHDRAGREEERDLVVEVEDEAPEDEADHHGRRDGHHDGEARTFAAPCAELVCYSHPASAMPCKIDRWFISSVLTEVFLLKKKEMPIV